MIDKNAPHGLGGGLQRVAGPSLTLLPVGEGEQVLEDAREQFVARFGLPPSKR